MPSSASRQKRRTSRRSRRSPRPRGTARASLPRWPTPSEPASGGGGTRTLTVVSDLLDLPAWLAMDPQLFGRFFMVADVEAGHGEGQVVIVDGPEPFSRWWRSSSVETSFRNGYCLDASICASAQAPARAHRNDCKVSLWSAPFHILRDDFATPKRRPRTCKLARHSGAEVTHGHGRRSVVSRSPLTGHRNYGARTGPGQPGSPSGLNRGTRVVDVHLDEGSLFRRWFRPAAG